MSRFGPIIFPLSRRNAIFKMRPRGLLQKSTSRSCSFAGRLPEFARSSRVCEYHRGHLNVKTNEAQRALGAGADGIHASARHDCPLVGSMRAAKDWLVPDTGSLKTLHGPKKPGGAGITLRSHDTAIRICPVSDSGTVQQLTPSHHSGTWKPSVKFARRADGNLV